MDELDLARDLTEAEIAHLESAEALDLARDLGDLPDLDLEALDDLPTVEVAKVLRKEGDAWVLRSQDGTRVLRRWKSKPSEAEVKKRERQVEFFKHLKK